MKSELLSIEFSPSTDYRKIAQELYESEEGWKQDIGNFILKWVGSSDYFSAQTSGSTGIPKEILLPKKAMRNSALMTGEFFGFKPGQKVLLCLSTNFIAGKMVVVRAIIHNMTLVITEPSSSPFQELETEIDFAAVVPTQLVETLNSPNGIQQLNRAKQLLVGGGPISETLNTKLQLLNSQVFASYGMTETISHVALRKVNGPHSSNWFEALPNITLTSDGRGCLVIQAPELSSETIVTNDLVKFLDPSHFIILGRVDNVINTGGIKVSPEVLEDKIAPFLTQKFFITSIPDEKFGSQLVLVIEGQQVAEEALLLQISSVLSNHEVPKKIYFLEKFILTKTGKIKRQESLAALLNGRSQ